MSKNMLSTIRDLEALEDQLALDAKRVKIEKVSLKEGANKDSKGDIRWARTNKVDDESIVAVFGPDSHLLGLPYRKRLTLILNRADELGLLEGRIVRVKA